MESTTTASANTSNAPQFLRRVAQLWCYVAVIGQLIFAAYVAYAFGPDTFAGRFERWNESLPNGYVAGDSMGNLAVGVHLLLAFVILVCGPLQFLPWLRRQARIFHRWNGRVYLSVAVITSLSGLYMVWTRGTVGDLTAHLSITLNGLLIIVCAYFTLRFAISGQLARHRRWAWRLFMVANGVFFFRIGLMFWLLINGGPRGFDMESFTGPFLVFLGIAQYALPLFLLQWYFRLEVPSAGRNRSRYALATLLLLLTLATAIGVFGAAVGMWFA